MSGLGQSPACQAGCLCHGLAREPQVQRPALSAGLSRRQPGPRSYPFPVRSSRTPAGGVCVPGYVCVTVCWCVCLLVYLCVFVCIYVLVCVCWYVSVCEG